LISQDNAPGEGADVACRVAIVGPVLPFRGGIAQHTTRLAQAFGQRCETSVFSFTRLYPRILYPGHSDIDPQHQGHREVNTRYLIDSLNPWTWLKAKRLLQQGNYTCVIFPWWTVFWFFCVGYLARAMRKARLEVVFVCHNVVEHEAAWWKAQLTRLVLKNASRFIVHTREDEQHLRRLLPVAKIVVHPHPVYDQFPQATATLPRRARLELLFYGFVRPYKGLDDLLTAMEMLRGQDIFLTVAGEIWQGADELASRIAQTGMQARIELRPQYHDEQDTAALFERADVIVLPYRSATGSGVLSLAYHYNRPVLVTRVGGLPDVVESGLTGWIVQPRAPEELAQTISAIDAGQLASMRQYIEVYKKQLSWDSLAAAISGSAGEAV
jgi:glycosyltransferase involved in cell wall biosynthesis